jgi:holo-[acyl-carrier protein] synthase
VIVGVGIDVVQVERLERALARTPRLGERLFTEAERALPPHRVAGRPLSPPRMAVAKALGALRGLRWRDAEVVSDDRRPALRLVLHGGVAEEAVRGHQDLALSMAHDAGVATAVVVDEA